MFQSVDNQTNEEMLQNIQVSLEAEDSDLLFDFLKLKRRFIMRMKHTFLVRCEAQVPPQNMNAASARTLEAGSSRFSTQMQNILLHASSGFSNIKSVICSHPADGIIHSSLVHSAAVILSIQAHSTAAVAAAAALTANPSWDEGHGMGF